jgi:antitoxin component of MazEF toxin-antitoxin module
MALIKRVRSVGNAAGLILDRPVLRQAGWDIGTEVSIQVEEGRIVLEAFQEDAGKLRGVRARGDARRPRGETVRNRLDNQ